MEAQNPNPKANGVTEKVNSELDSLKNQIINTESVVVQQQATVNSLTEKSEKNNGYLQIAENNRANSLNHKNAIDQIVQNAHSLILNSKIASNTAKTSSESTDKMATAVSDLINKLLYSAEIINKLSNLVIRQKALNPLISDDLITRINIAGKDANNAVALTLVALKSTLAAQTSSIESEAAVTLELKQATKLYLALTSEKSIDTPLSPQAVSNTSIKGLLYTSHKNAQAEYEKATLANDETIQQLNIAKTNLDEAQTRLKSLQSALAAVNAAALAS